MRPITVAVTQCKTRVRIHLCQIIVTFGNDSTWSICKTDFIKNGLNVTVVRAIQMLRRAIYPSKMSQKKKEFLCVSEIAAGLLKILVASATLVSKIFPYAHFDIIMMCFQLRSYPDSI